MENVKLKASEIALDVDGVLVDTFALFIIVAKDMYGLHLDYCKITDYDLRKCFNISDDVAFSLYEIILQDSYNSQLQLIAGAKNVMQKLAQRLEKIILITARHELNNFKGWLAKVFEIAEERFEIIATGGFENKLNVLRQYKRAVMVEDRLETCFYLADHGITPLVFAQPWNRKPHPFMDVDWQVIDTLIDWDA